MRAGQRIKDFKGRVRIFENVIEAVVQITRECSNRGMAGEVEPSAAWNLQVAFESPAALFVAQYRALRGGLTRTKGLISKCIKEIDAEAG